MDIILIALAGFILLLACLRLPQWVANKTGKTILIRGKFIKHVTYKPDEYKKAQKQFKEISAHLEQINQSLLGEKNFDLNYDSLYTNLTDTEKTEYKLFPIFLRVQLPIAIKEHIVITDFSDNSERLKIKQWLIKYLELYQTLKTIHVDSLTTLIHGEDAQIIQFFNLYQKDFNSTLEQTALGKDNNFI